MVLEALGLGLSSGLFCLGVCFPVLGPLMLSSPGSTVRAAAARLGLFLCGRLVGYAAFGALAGAAGWALRGLPTWGGVVLPSAYVLLGALLALYGLAPRLPFPRACAAGTKVLQGPGGYLLLGLLTGVNVCPPFLLAAGLVVEGGSALRGMLFFLVFFAATSVYVLPFLLSPLLARTATVRIAARICAVIAGGWFVFQGIRRLVGVL